MKQKIALILIIQLFILQSYQGTCPDNTANSDGTNDDQGDPKNCVNCIDGYFSSDKVKKCDKRCPAGKTGVPKTPITKAVEDVACKSCANGFWSDEATPSEKGCTKCADGYYSNPDKQCDQKCPAGYIGQGVSDSSNSGKDVACKICEANKFAKEGTPSTTGCSSCGSGSLSKSGDAECYCVDGKFSSINQDVCDKNCPGGKVGVPGIYISRAFEGVACKKCPVGFWSDDGTPSDKPCTKCADGYYSSPGNKCDQKCPAGYVGLGVRDPSNSGKDVACKICEAGQFSNAGTPSTTGCFKCVYGSWSNAGDSKCGFCVDGRFSSDNDVCDKNCPMGYVGTGVKLVAQANQDAQCTKCAPGTITTVEGTSSVIGCKKCDKGYWSNEASSICNLCMDGYYSEDRKTCQPCEANKIGKGGVNPIDNALKDTVCVPCPIGYTSPQGNPSTTPCIVAHALLLEFSFLCLLFVGLLI